MSVLITASVDADDFVFGETLGRNPNCSIELEPSISVRREVIPHAYVRGCVRDRIGAELGSEADVASADVVDTTGDEALVRIRWKTDVSVALLETLRAASVTVLRALGRAGSWELRLRFPTSDAVSQFYRRCLDRDITVEPRRVRQVGSASTARTEGLTRKQREALVRAFDAGYFDVPRRITLTELADQLGVSDTAVSERLRRGTSAMITGTLFEGNRPSEWAESEFSHSKH